MTSRMSKQQQRMKEIADEYRRKGYQVVEEPEDELLPEFLENYRPDLLAWNDNEHVILEFKDQQTLVAENYLKELAALIDARPDWRLELIVFGPPRPMPGLLNAKTLSPEQIRQYVSSARLLLQNDEFLSAQLVAWSALEATLRTVAEENGMVIERPGPEYLIKTLYSAGLLTHVDFEFLQNAIWFRNRLIHGFQPSSVARSEVEMLLSMIEEKLAELITGPDEVRVESLVHTYSPPSSSGSYDEEGVRRRVVEEVNSLTQAQLRTFARSRASMDSWIYRVAHQIGRILSVPFRWIADLIQGFLEGFFGGQT